MVELHSATLFAGCDGQPAGENGRIATVGEGRLTIESVPAFPICWRVAVYTHNMVLFFCQTFFCQLF